MYFLHPVERTTGKNKIFNTILFLHRKNGTNRKYFFISASLCRIRNIIVFTRAEKNWKKVILGELSLNLHALYRTSMDGSFKNLSFTDWKK